MSTANVDEKHETVPSATNIFTAGEMAANLCKACVKKVQLPIYKMLLLSILAGMLIALGAAVSNTAVYSFTNVSIVRLISGLLFPFGLVMVVLMGAELFTGNCLLPVSVLNREVKVTGMLQNWGFVYFGNFIGAILVAVSIAFFGQLNYSSGALAVFTIKVAAAKVALPFLSAVVMGIFCNFLVCLAILCSLCAKDAAGRIMGTYIPVAVFVISGFEHSVANMYYIPTGLFAINVPAYAAQAAAAGINVSGLTWHSFFVNKLLPVTIGNIIGGVALGALMWACYLRKPKNEQRLAVDDHREKDIRL